jgi:hypothetical protein
MAAWAPTCSMGILSNTTLQACLLPKGGTQQPCTHSRSSPLCPLALSAAAGKPGRLAASGCQRWVPWHGALEHPAALIPAARSQSRVREGAGTLRRLPPSCRPLAAPSCWPPPLQGGRQRLVGRHPAAAMACSTHCAALGRSRRASPLQPAAVLQPAAAAAASKPRVILRLAAAPLVLTTPVAWNKHLWVSTP